MAIKPILFNTDMVRAIMDGRKTCTRRMVKPQWEECPHCKYVHNEYIYDEMAENVYCARCGYPLEPERRSPYQPEDILYVRETWHRYTKRVGKGEGCHLEEHYGYKASIANSEDAEEPWKPSIHMPKKAARICLKVTNVSVERLQDITGDGAEAEGCFDYDVFLMTEEHYDYESKSRPEWCPLMDLPEKDNGDYPANTFDAGFVEGRNQCIDEITGGE